MRLTPVSLLLMLLAAAVLAKIQLVVVLLVLAIILATGIERPVALLERRRVPRRIGILAIYAGMALTLAVSVALIAPLIRDEAVRFRTDAPAQLRTLRDDWRQSEVSVLNGPAADLLQRAATLIERPPEPPAKPLMTLAAGVGSVALELLTVLTIAYFYLTEKASIREVTLARLSPETRARIAGIWDAIEAQVGRWLRGQLLLCLIIGGAAFIGYGAIGLPFWALLAVWAGITEAIPMVGSWLGGIPAVTIALTQSWDKALLVAGFVTVLQLSENLLLVPRVMRGAVGLSPLTVFLAIMAGAQYLGVAGALLAIPVAAALQVVIADLFRARRPNVQPGVAAPGWRWLHLASDPQGSADTVRMPKRK